MNGHKYNVGDQVWIMRNDFPLYCQIRMVHISKFGICYSLEQGGASPDEDQVFATKEELLDNIKKQIENIEASDEGSAKANED